MLLLLILKGDSMFENNLSKISCCFFGHRDTSQSVEPLLIKAIEKMILNQNVRYFYVGNQGNFDSMVLSSLKKLEKHYPQITYSVVLAYMPSENTDKKYENISLYPDGMEWIPKRFAISRRNYWMIEHSDFVICYIRHHFGGAYQFVEKAKKRKCVIINLFSEK